MAKYILLLCICFSFNFAQDFFEVTPDCPLMCKCFHLDDRIDCQNNELIDLPRNISPEVRKSFYFYFFGTKNKFKNVFYNIFTKNANKSFVIA